MMLALGDDGDDENPDLYVYTDGKTLTELGVDSEDDMDKLPKINISETTTSVAFNKFESVSEYEE
jgi:hypothetical protein